MSTPQTIVEHFYHWEESSPDRPFLRQPFGDDWKTYSYRDAGQEARRIVSYLRSCGVQAGDHIGIYSKNCAHWFIADLAIMIGGFVSVPFYASLPADQLTQIIDLADLKALFIGRLDSWSEIGDSLDPDLSIVRMPGYASDAQVTIGREWNSIIDSTPPISENFVPDLDDLWTIKFTSGTTGTPKGVMHTHRSPALIMENEKTTGWIGLYDIPNLRFFSYLPLNHVGERLGVEMAAITLGSEVSFVENQESFAKNIADTQPGILFAVPRIWTLFYQGVLAKLPEKRLDMLLRIPVLSTYLRRKLRTKMGLNNIKVAATGAAITPSFIKNFYAKLGIHLIEAYGMTEVCGSIANGPDPDTPLGSVGKAIPFGNVKVDERTGEILMKSPYMMKGYYKDAEKTAEVLDGNWLHSGDKGEISEDGYIFVTGRINDSFKTAKGSYVTPNPLEEAVAKNSFVEQVCVVGLGIPQPIALVNLSESAGGKSNQEVEKSIIESIDTLNQTRAKFERISTAVIVSEPWSVENGFLTPTLKVKRGEIDKHNSENYHIWHNDEQQVIWC